MHYQWLPGSILGDCTSICEFPGLFQAEATGVQVSARSEFKDSYLTLLVH